MKEVSMRKDVHEANRLSWNEATVAQDSHRGDQVAFFRNGGSTLYPEERELLGDLRGQSVLHLQCNTGQDSLSLAQLGACVTGVDISDTAISRAQQLAQETALPATFHRMDVYDWLDYAAKKQLHFHTIFCSYGTLSWLSDLSTWAKGGAAILAPAGRLCVIDYHPIMLTLDEEQQRRYPYGMEKVPDMVTWKGGVSDFVAQAGCGLPGEAYVEGIASFQNPYPAYEFYWGLGQIVTAVVEAGLILQSLKEYSYCNGYKPFYEMRQVGRRWYLPAGQPSFPLMYSFTAKRCK